MDTPNNIKKHFGVGYILILEHKDADNNANMNLNEIHEELRDLFASGRFVSKKSVESIDSTDKKIIF